MSAAAEVEKKETPRTLTDRALKVVNYAEQKFWELGNLPSYEAIAAGVNDSSEFVKSTVEKNHLARKSLIVRGVDLSPSESAQLLSSEQLLAANLVLNAHDERSVREKLDFLGISSQKWHSWLRQPGFSQYMSKRAEAAFEANDFAAYNALADNIDEGKLDAVKFHFEMRGKYKQTVDVNVNVEQLLVSVVEIIANHVNDQETILAIAEDLASIGEQPALTEAN